MKYIEKRVVVKAEQYQPGMEDVTVIGGGKRNVYILGPSMSDRDMLLINPGDFIITYRDGRRMPISQEEFQSNYELVGEGVMLENCFIVRYEGSAPKSVINHKKRALYKITDINPRYIAPEYKKFKIGDVVLLYDKDVRVFKFKKYNNERNVFKNYVHGSNIQNAVKEPASEV